MLASLTNSELLLKYVKQLRRIGLNSSLQKRTLSTSIRALPAPRGPLLPNRLPRVLQADPLIPLRNRQSQSRSWLSTGDKKDAAAAGASPNDSKPDAKASAASASATSAAAAGAQSSGSADDKSSKADEKAGKADEKSSQQSKEQKAEQKAEQQQQQTAEPSRWPKHTTILYSALAAGAFGLAYTQWDAIDSHILTPLMYSSGLAVSPEFAVTGLHSRVESQSARDVLWAADPGFTKLLALARSDNPQTAGVGLLLLTRMVSAGDVHIIGNPSDVAAAASGDDMRTGGMAMSLAQLAMERMLSPEREIALTASQLLMELLQYVQVCQGFLRDNGLVKLLDMGAMLTAQSPAAAEVLIGPVAAVLPHLGANNIPEHIMKDREKKAQLMQLMENVGRTYEMFHNYQHALHAYKLLYWMDVSNPIYAAMVAAVFERMGDEQQARAILRHISQSYPQLIEPLPLLMHARIEARDAKRAAAQGNESEARRHLTAATRMLEQGLVGAIEIRRQTIVQHQQAQQRQGGQSLGPSLLDTENLPNDLTVPILQLLVNYYERLGNLKDATHKARAWAGLFKNDARAHFAYGRLLLKTGNAKDAVGSLHRAFTLNSSVPEPAYKLALAAEALGRHEEALQWGRQALQIAHQLQQKEQKDKEKAKKHEAELKAQQAQQAKSGQPAPPSPPSEQFAEHSGGGDKEKKDKGKSKVPHWQLTQLSADRLIGRVYAKQQNWAAALDSYDRAAALSDALNALPAAAAAAATAGANAGVAIAAPATTPASPAVLSVTPLVHYERGQILQVLNRGADAIVSYTRAVDAWRAICASPASVAASSANLAASGGGGGSTKSSGKDVVAAHTPREAFFAKHAKDAAALDDISRLCVNATTPDAEHLRVLCDRVASLRAMP